jgi:integrase
MKTLHRLSDRTVKTTLPGKYCDGAGLYLVVTQGRCGINRNWTFRYGVGDRQRWHGLGAYPLVGLAEARRRAQDTRELLLPYKELPAFMAELREQEHIAAHCLEFLILTACRTAEAVLARWNEIDLEAREWTVAAERTKALREHRIPLSDQAVDLLNRLPRINEYVFPVLTWLT